MFTIKNTNKKITIPRFLVFLSFFIKQTVVNVLVKMEFYLASICLLVSVLF